MRRYLWQRLVLQVRNHTRCPRRTSKKMSRGICIRPANLPMYARPFTALWLDLSVAPSSEFFVCFRPRLTAGGVPLGSLYLYKVFRSSHG